ncbi:hypothetical protein ABEB36_005433 [Hypothenemus hampei]|uniref:Nuclear receptor subfamily 2 group E member 1 n=1 Tax=Hypothenemus hampei TaxID=57062 RepID=A0ABD1EY74_HYPHA
MTITSSRILDIPCKVCGDYSSGKHYNIFACDGCAGFFKRSIRRNRRYICKGKEEGTCVIDKAHRNQCRACRLNRCQEAGMNKEAVQHERGPRNSTIRKAMSTFFEEQHQRVIASNIQTCGGVLNLSMPRPSFPAPPPPPAQIFSRVPMLHPALSYLPRIPLLPFPPPLQSSPPPSPTITSLDIYESAASLIIFTVQWAKSQPFFLALPMEDQLALLETTWKDLFILDAINWLPSVNLTLLMENNEKFKTDDSKRRVQDFQETLLQGKHFQLDPQEISLLRVIFLLKGVSSESGTEDDTGKKLVQESAVKLIVNEAQINLNKYVTSAKPHDPLRFNKLLLLLGKIRSISSEDVVDLFFRKALGTLLSMEYTIANMYKQLFD